MLNRSAFPNENMFLFEFNIFYVQIAIIGETGSNITCIKQICFCFSFLSLVDMCNRVSDH